MHVRRRTPEDLPGCVRVLADVHATDGYPSRWPDDPAAWLSPAGCDAGWVAEQAGAVVGHVVVIRGVDDPVVAAASGASPDQLGAVSRLFVASQVRSHGVATSLMDEVTAYADAEGMRLMLDVVEDGGPAVAFYQRLGWRQVDRRPAGWMTSDGRRLPMRIYLQPGRRRRPSR